MCSLNNAWCSVYVDLPLKMSFKGDAWRIPILWVCRRCQHFTTNTFRQMGGQDGFYWLAAKTSAKAAFACLTLIKMEKKRVENVINDPWAVSIACTLQLVQWYSPVRGRGGLAAVEAPLWAPQSHHKIPPQFLSSLTAKYVEQMC